MTWRARVQPGWPLLCLVVALLYVYLLAPVVVVVIEAFNGAELMRFPPREWSARWFGTFLRRPDFVGSFRVSLALALVTAVLSTIAGTLAAYGLIRFRRGRQAGMETFLLAPLYVPRVLIGLSLLLALSSIRLAGTFTGLALAHVLITVPYVVRSVTASLHGVDPAVEEAARCLGATPAQTFLRVTLPLIRTATLAGALFAFMVSFTDVYLALFLSGPQTVTLPVRVFHFMEWEQSPLVAAVSTVQLLFIVGLAVVTERLTGFSSTGRF